MDDIGDTPAEGGIYQLDAIVAECDDIKMDGRIDVGDVALLGAPLHDARGAEAHIAMAPHGMAYTGADLERQMMGAIGTPPFWFAAIFD